MFHKHADEQHTLVRENSHRAKLREIGLGYNLSMGDYCLVSRPLTQGISQRFQRRYFDEVYQVVEIHGDGHEAKAYTLSNLSGARHSLGFTQPVALDRLSPIDMLPTAEPCGDSEVRVVIGVAGTDLPGTIVNQTLDGKVFVIV